MPVSDLMRHVRSSRVWPRPKALRVVAVDGHAPRLWSVWVAAPFALATAIAVAGALYLWLRHSAPLVETYNATGQKLYQVDRLELVKTTITVSGFIGAVLAGMYGYRKQRLSEGDARRADTDQFSNRYSKAAEQLGHDKAAVRLAGVYAMARLADDWSDQRQVCIDVLCAYLRMPYSSDPDSPTYREGEREVRHTIIRVIRDHLTEDASRPWSGCDFDFTGAVFDGGSFRNAVFSGGTVQFNEAKFSGGTVDFWQAKFSGGTVSFWRAEFSGGTVQFNEAKFSGGTVHFNWAKFSGGSVSFARAKFLGGSVSFARAKISGGIMYFSEAEFSGGTMHFFEADFSGGAVDFVKAKFLTGIVGFHGAHFSGGTLTFHAAEFSGAPVDFEFVHHTSGAVDWGPFPPVPRNGGLR